VNANGLKLRALRVEDESSFRKAVEEFSREVPPWQFAFGFTEALVFSEYVRQLEGHSRGIDVPKDFVPNTFLVGVVDSVVVGRLSLRHSLNDFLAKVGGHIGYGVIPSQRNRGYATEMPRQALPVCVSLGIEKTLVTCDEHNVRSQMVVENCGGIFEGIVDCPDSEIRKRRYWIRTADVKEGLPSQSPAPTLASVTPDEEQPARLRWQRSDSTFGRVRIKP
jgi:predicted acetyltransferase